MYRAALGVPGLPICWEHLKQGIPPQFSDWATGNVLPVALRVRRRHMSVAQAVAERA